MDKRCDVNCAPRYAFVDKYIVVKEIRIEGKGERTGMGAKNGKIE